MPRRRAPSASAGPSTADLTAAVAAATEELAGRDPVLARLVAAVGPCELDARGICPTSGRCAAASPFSNWRAGRGHHLRPFVAVATGGERPPT